MGGRKRIMTAVFLPVFLGMLSCPAWAGTTGRKAGHYPGQDCSGCHKIRGKSTGKTVGTKPAKSVPANPAPDIGTSGPKTAPPAKGAAPSR